PVPHPHLQVEPLLAVVRQFPQAQDRSTRRRIRAVLVALGAGEACRSADVPGLERVLRKMCVARARGPCLRLARQTSEEHCGAHRASALQQLRAVERRSVARVRLRTHILFFHALLLVRRRSHAAASPCTVPNTERREATPCSWNCPDAADR